ncbi:MAG: hypothetical protein ABSH56_25650 [Bryobacteraceae bacterium]|jgi:hypothetical protein
MRILMLTALLAAGLAAQTAGPDARGQAAQPRLGTPNFLRPSGGKPGFRLPSTFAAAPSAGAGHAARRVCAIPLVNVTPKGAGEMDQGMIVRSSGDGENAMSSVVPPAPSCDDGQR